jgi:hypothetical protein
MIRRPFQTACSVCLAIVVSAVGVRSGLGQEATPKPQPRTGVARIVLKEKNFAFPPAQRGPKLRHAFKFTNMGDKDLVIYSVKPGCGCTVAEYDEVVRPGEDGRILLTLDSNRVGGSFTKTATVKTNDPDNSEIRLQITGRVESPYTISPRDNLFLHSVVGEEISDRIFIGASDGKPFEIKNVTSSLNEYVDYEIKDVVKGEKYMLSVRTLPQAKPGVYNGKILVETDKKESPRFTVDVSVNIRGEVNVSPRLLNFGRVERDQKKEHTRTVKVELETGKDLEVLDASTSSPYFQVTPRTVDKGRVYTLGVSLVDLPPETALRNGVFKDRLIVKTNKKGYESIDVSLLVEVQ